MQEKAYTIHRADNISSMSIEISGNVLSKKKQQNLTSIKDRSSVENLRKMTLYNPNIDLVKMKM